MSCRRGGGAPKKLATRLAGPVRLRLVLRLDHDRGAARPGSREAAADHGRRRQRRPADDREGFFTGVSFSPEGSDSSSTRRAASENFPPRSDIYSVDSFPRGRQRRRRAATAADQRPPLLDPLWGPNERSSSSSTWAKRAQVRPQERALPDEPERQRSSAHPHQGRPAAAGLQPDRMVGERQAPARRVRAARTPATRSPSTRRPASSGPRQGTRGASSAPRSPATATRARQHGRLRPRPRAQGGQASPTGAASRRCSPTTPPNPTGVAELERDDGRRSRSSTATSSSRWRGRGIDLAPGAQGAGHLGLRLQPGRNRSRRPIPEHDESEQRPGRALRDPRGRGRPADRGRGPPGARPAPSPRSSRRPPARSSTAPSARHRSADRRSPRGRLLARFLRLSQPGPWVVPEMHAVVGPPRHYAPHRTSTPALVDGR